MKAPGYQNINNIKLMQQNIGCNILAFSDILLLMCKTTSN